MGWQREYRRWRSGDWTFELRDDEIADLTFSGRRVLRSIRAVIRDEDWNTAALVVDAVDEAAPGRVRLQLHSEGFGADLRGTVMVIASTDAVKVELNLEAHDDFWTNRTGLVVLHPPQVTGMPLSVTHSDGSVENATFPQTISPLQPAFDIASLRWRDGGTDIQVQFDGDVFEMEDQRNWTDASFKTYNRPLSLPFPYRLTAHEVLTQAVRVQARVLDLPEPSTPPQAREQITLAPGGAVPTMGVGAATAPDPAPPFAGAGEPVLVELDLATPTWRAAVARAAAGAAALDVRFVLSTSDPDALVDGLRALIGLPVARVAAFQADGPARHVSDRAATSALRDALTSSGLDVEVVGGVRSHFTELNREHDRLPDDLAGIVFSVTPLFHSMGTEQLVESLAIQRLVARQAVSMAAGAPVHIGPVTLRPHFNDVAATPPPMSARSDLAEGYGTHLLDADDERYNAPELAAWTIASFAALAVPGVATLTYYEQWGPRGRIGSDGTARPVTDALDALTALRGTTLLHSESADGLVWAVAGTGPETTTVLAANLDRHEREFLVDTPAGRVMVNLEPGCWRSLTL